MNDANINVASREARARHRLRELGYCLQKAPARSRWREASYYGGYMVLSESGRVLVGACGNPYSATLDDVEWFTGEEEKRPHGVNEVALTPT